jgi:teichoic acid transport system permease protein
MSVSVDSAAPPPCDRRELRPVAAVPGPLAYLRDIWARREFVATLPFEQLRTAHLNTVLGNLWHLGNPILTAGVYYVIFGIVFGTSDRIPNYVLWLIIGVFTYGLTASSVLGGAKAINDYQGLMRSFRFPRAIVPLASVIGTLYTFAFQFVVIALIALISGVAPSPRLLTLPAIVMVHTCLNLGGALIAARLNDTFRDVQQLIPFVFRLLQYSSGVMIPLDRFLETDHRLIEVFVTYNPLVHLINAYRWAVAGGQFDVRQSIIASITAVVLLVVGFVFFRAGEHRYGRT